MPPEQPPFRFWLRRSSAGEPSCALRFEVFEGRGVLRTVRPGVLVDPPARVSGYEAELALPQVRASRFLHVSNYGRRRQTWFLTRISDDLVALMEADAWVELTPITDRGAFHLLLLSAKEVGALPAQAAAPPAPAPARRETPLASSLPITPPAPAADRAPPEAPTLPAGAPSTGVIRHLRRQLAAERLRTLELAARVASLERRLRARAQEAAPTLKDSPER